MGWRKILSKPDVGHISLYPCSDKCHAFIHAKLLEGFSELFRSSAELVRRRYTVLRRIVVNPAEHLSNSFRGAIVLGLPIFKHPWNSRSGLVLPGQSD